MLAYVFWHWPVPSVGVSEYERSQRVFHASLAEAAPAGFVRSTVYRVTGEAAWLAAAPAYADWYLLESSAAIDALNVAAVTGISTEPHNAVAHAMAAGAGSLFGLRTGTPDLPSARHASFLTKPRDLPYPEFDAQMAATPDSSAASIWRRALVLGPTPEFAVLSASPLDLPQALQPLRLELTPL